jgi:hypothetical protein
MPKQRMQRSRKRASRGEQGGGPIAIPRAPRETVFRTKLTSYVRTTDISVPGAALGDYIVLSQFPTATAFTGVFDQYRILNATMEYIPLCVTSFILGVTVSTGATNAVYNHNVLSTCIDTDDGNAPAGEATVLSHESAMIHGPLVKSYQRSWVPAIALESYQTGGFGGYSSRTNQWCDSASPNVQHYGIKAVVTRGVTSPTGTVLMAQYAHSTVEFRKVF